MFTNGTKNPERENTGLRLGGLHFRLGFDGVRIRPVGDLGGRLLFGRDRHLHFLEEGFRQHHHSLGNRDEHASRYLRITAFTKPQPGAPSSRPRARLPTSSHRPHSSGSPP